VKGGKGLLVSFLKRRKKSASGKKKEERIFQCLPEKSRDRMSTLAGRREGRNAWKGG